MAIRSGFFNSVNGDRKYDAKSFAEYFASFIGNGVFPKPSTSLQVMANDDMTVTVKPGKAWINGYILINDDDYILQIEPADGVLNRIDRIVARYDIANREIRLEVKKGTFASSPIAPELQRDSDAYELGLADIYVKAGATSISQADITDLRLNSELCGVVHGLIEQVDTTTLFAQYQAWYQQTTGQAEVDLEMMKQQFQAEFDAWFAGIKDILDESTAGNLLNLIEEHKNDTNNPHNVTPQQIGAVSQEDFMSHKNENATLNNLGHVYHDIITATLDTEWEGEEAPYTKIIEVEGILGTDVPIIDVVLTGNYETDTAILEAWGNIYRAVTADGSITFYTIEKPANEITVQIKVVR